MDIDINNMFDQAYLDRLSWWFNHPMKACSRCNSPRHAISNNYHVNRDTSDGLHRICKKCVKETNRLSRKKRLQDPTFRTQELARYAQLRDQLSDSYVKHCIQKSFRQEGIKISYSEIPQELIELKRKQLKLKRDVKNKHDQ